MNGFSLLRVFVPSWRFFDRPGTPLVAQYRFGPTQEQLGEWRDCQRTFVRKPWNLFFNPNVNLYHALQSLTERFVIEAQNSANSAASTESFEHNVSYQLMLNWARRLAAPHAAPLVQFRVQAQERDPNAAAFQMHDVVTSLVHPNV